MWGETGQDTARAAGLVSGVESRVSGVEPVTEVSGVKSQVSGVKW